ncbi:MAG TPA: DUF3015 family protein [Pseudomonadales bacterium]|nr:DUF3015 family protein [Pseudomonadales bacterium]
MKHIAIATATLFAALSTMNANAQGRDIGRIYTECGLGGAIAPTSDVVAAITNITFDLGTTAISSNMSSPETCNGGKEVKAAALIINNTVALEKEAAAGEGETLAALEAVSGCSTANVRRDLAVAPTGQTQLERAQLIWDSVQSTCSM